MPAPVHTAFSAENAAEIIAAGHTYIVALFSQLLRNLRPHHPSRFTHGQQIKFVEGW